ncbi:MAG: hypothetical protein U5N10_14210 [Gemmobacter sp.]|nr:hypothetical protein [Gemmobacter sp.]
MPAVTALDAHLAEFNAKWDTEVKITLLGENERRAKARLDASTGAGAYQVLYIDEANLAEYVSAGWVHPLADVVPAEYDLADFAPIWPMSHLRAAFSISRPSWVAAM